MFSLLLLVLALFCSCASSIAWSDGDAQQAFARGIKGDSIPYSSSFSKQGLVRTSDLRRRFFQRPAVVTAPPAAPERHASAAVVSSFVVQPSSAYSRRTILEGSPSPSPLPSGSAAPSPSIAAAQRRRHRNKAQRWIVGILIGVLAGAIPGVLFGFLGRAALVLWRRSRNSKRSIILFNRKISPKTLAFLNTDGCLGQMEEIGKGGAGTVYKVVLEDGLTVAIKRLPIKNSEDSMGSFGRHHAVTEMETLGNVRHMNLVTLFAYVRTSVAHHLVYEFMPNCSLHDVLTRVREGNLELGWAARKKIAVGVATGLKYLHHDCTPRILHRDLKTSNVLLDAEFEAHLGDFGLAKALPEEMSHVTTNLAGTIGYIAPEYHQTCKFTPASDMYSFGIVLGVLLSGKEPTDESFKESDVDMADWFVALVETGQELRGIDPALLSGIDNDDENAARELMEMKLAMRVVCHCTKTIPVERPSSKDALIMLNPTKLRSMRSMRQIINET